MQDGILITFEGIEGCGKTTQAKKIYNYLLKSNYNVILTQEPGATKIGEIVREILLSVTNKNIDPYAELYLYLADRAQHLNEIIYPNYENGKIIICDRYYHSTIVYQGFARNIGLETIDLLHSVMPSFVTPNITFILDVSVDESVRRTKKRMQEEKSNLFVRFELEERAFHEKIRQGYLEIQKRESSKVLIIDGMKEIDEITTQIINYLKEFGIIKRNE